jgi:hypothetical protein
MKSEIEILAEQALGFSSAARAYLAEILLESIDYEENFSLSSEWITEIQRRCGEIDSGRECLVDGETALADLRRKYGSL